MPTIPPELHTEAHQRRDIAESFGSEAERYDRARPCYPQAMVDRIVASSPGPDVLDVGCGTGIAALQFEAAGCKVLGVDVDARMADLARHNGIEVEVAKFEDWQPAGRDFDAVIAGQAWHWVDPVVGAAKSAGVLRPGGLLAPFWNILKPPTEVSEAFSAIYRRVVPDLPFNPWSKPAEDAYSTVFARVTDPIRDDGAFGAVEQWRFEWDWSYSTTDWLDQLPTFGGHSQLPPAQLEEIVEGVGAVIDSMGGGFTTHYTTVVISSAARLNNGP